MEEIMNNEVIENVNEEVTDLTVPEAEDTTVLEESENSNVGALAIGAGICGLAVVGAIALGRATYKHVLKPIGNKIKNAVKKKEHSEPPIVETTAVDESEDDTDETEE